MKIIIFILLVICFNSLLISCSEFSSVSKVLIGKCAEGDKNILTDHHRANSLTYFAKNLTIKFEYTIDKLITCIQLESETNAEIKYNVTYYNNFLRGQVTAVNVREFDIWIQIYGFDSLIIPQNSKFLLKKNSTYVGRFRDDYDEYDDYEDYDFNFDDVDDTIIKLGERQENDTLLFEIIKHSDRTKELTNHSVVFYFIDDAYLTHAKVTVISTTTASAKFSYVTNNSIKAYVEDKNVTSLSAHFALYGYEANKKPFNYRGFIPSAPENLKKQEIGLANYASFDKVLQVSVIVVIFINILVL